MNIKSIYSTKNTVTEVVKDINDQLIGFDTKMLIFFASSIFDPNEIGKLMYESFPNSIVFGCSTAGELTTGKMLKNSVVAMAFNSEVIEDAKITVIEDIKNSPNVNSAFKTFDEYFNEPISSADYSKYVGIVLIDGLSGSEEKMMDLIGDKTNCTIIGGSTGDDLKFLKTYVYANGSAYTNAAILTMLKCKVGFDIIKTQSFKVLNKKLIATKVDLASRKVLEFNNEPAMNAYANALGVTKENAAELFLTHPVGLVVDNEIFVRSPKEVTEDGIIFHCNILEGMELSLLESKDIVSDTKTSVNNKKDELGSISGIINFHCILRTLDLEQKKQTEEYGKLFSEIPTVGFSTYGEAYLGHINQTSTMLVFK